jgi:predicted transcriptional regulator
MSRQSVETARIRAADLTRLAAKHGFNKAAMAKELGCSRQAVQQRMKQPLVLQTLKEQFEQLGYGRAKLAARFIEKAECKKPIGASILVSQQGQLIRAEDEGAIEVDDNAVQLRALEDIARLSGELTDQPALPSEVHQHFTVILDAGVVVASDARSQTHPQADLSVSLTD